MRRFLLGFWLWSLLLVPSGEAAQLTTTPSQGLTAALAQMRGGDTLLVGCGTYPERIPGGAIPSGTQAQPTVIRAERKRCAILTPGGGTTMLFQQQSFIVLDGLVIDKRNQASGEGVMFREGAHHITVQNMEIGNFLRTGSCSPSQGFGTSTSGMPNILLAGNYVHDIGTDDHLAPSHTSCDYSYGIYLASPGYTLENNEFARISGYAVHGYPSPDNTILRNNYFHETGPVLVKGANSSIYNNILKGVGRPVSGSFPASFPFDRQSLLGGGPNTIWYNNTVIDGGNPAEPSKSACLDGKGASGTIARNNICTGGANDTIVGVAQVSNNLLGTNPQFVTSNPSKPSDFQVQAGSPARNTGMATASTMSTDMGGQPRIQEGVQDIGAWEYSGGPVVPPEPQPGAGPLAWWKFNEGQGTQATDASGHGHTLRWTTNPGPTWATALQCDGTNNGASTAAGDVIPITRAYTWALWFASRVRPSVGMSDQQVFYQGEQFGFFWSANDACCVAGASHRLASGDYITPPKIATPLTAGQVYYIAATWDGQTVRLYLDGELQASQAAASLFAQGTGLRVCNPSASPVVGSLGDFQIWDRALTAAEIRANATMPPR